MILASLCGLAVLPVLSAAALLQGAHALTCACCCAGGSRATRIPYYAARTASFRNNRL